MARPSTRGVLWEVIAPVVRWPLRSPARLIGTIVAGIVLMCAVGRLDGGQDTAPEPATSSTSSTSTPSTSSPTSTASSPTSTTTPTATGSSTSSTASASPSPRSTSSAADTDREDWGSTKALSAQEKAARPAVSKARTLATKVVAHRTSPRATWWKAVRPYLSPSGRQQLEQLGPRGLPFTKVTGKAGLIVTEADMGKRFTSVAVPTNKGTYLFLVEKSGVASISQVMPDDEEGA